MAEWAAAKSCGGAGEKEREVMEAIRVWIGWGLNDFQYLDSALVDFVDVGLSFGFTGKVLATIW